MRILLVQTSFLGDVILSTPVIAGIHQIFPSAELWMVTTPQGAELVERDPLLAGVIPFDKRGTDSGVGGLLRFARRLSDMGFNRAYALQRSLRTSLALRLAGIPHRVGFRAAKGAWLYHNVLDRSSSEHDVIRNLSLLAGDGPIESFSTRLRLFAPEFEDLSPKVRAVINRISGGVILVPGSAWFTKQWTWQGYKEVAEHFLNLGQEVVLVGAPAERELCERVAEGLTVCNLAGETSLSDLLYIIHSAGLVVCNDSMALHMASAFRTPTVAVFCATSPSFGFGPWENAAAVVQKPGLHCRPCRRHGSHRCPTGTELCMHGVRSEEVIWAAEGVLR